MPRNSSDRPQDLPDLSPIRFSQSPAASKNTFFLNHLILGALLLTACASAVLADSSLTLDLPPSPEAIALRNAEQAKQPVTKIPEAPKADRAPGIRMSRASRSPSRGYYPSRGQSEGSERIVGRLGQLSRSSSIYRSQSVQSARLSSVPAGTYLAIQSEAGSWYGILMADGSLGWLHRSSVKLMEYQVVSNGATPAPTPSAGAYTNNGVDDGLPAGKSAFFRGDPQALFRDAYRYLGVPYHFGGNGADGIDCSAFVKSVFEANGYSLPRHSSDQMAYGLMVPKEDLQPGDRLYFGHPATKSVTHTGLYIGNGYFIHASSNRHGVAISNLSEALYERMYVCARR